MELKDLILKHVDLKGMVKELVAEFIAPKLRDAAAKSKHGWDDALVESLIKFLQEDDEQNMTEQKTAQVEAKDESAKA